jgi:hypothetical protein
VQDADAEMAALSAQLDKHTKRLLMLAALRCATDHEIAARASG